MEGWIKLHRQIIDSPVFAHQTALKIWIWCLCKANHSGKSFPISTGKGETIVSIERGQFIFGRFKAEDELGINGSTVYKWMHKFSDEMDMINIESNTHYSIITILNFNDFQDLESNKVTTKEQPSNNQVTTKEQPSNTYKNDKNDKNDIKELSVFIAVAYKKKYNRDSGGEVGQDIDYMSQRLLSSMSKTEAMEQIRAHKLYTAIQSLTLPSKPETIQAALLETDWVQRMKEKQDTDQTQSQITNEHARNKHRNGSGFTETIAPAYNGRIDSE
jgi:hypothetical protein